MKPDEIKRLKRRLIAVIAEELGGTVKRGNFSKYSKDGYSLYGRSNFIKDWARPKKKKKK